MIVGRDSVRLTDHAVIRYNVAEGQRLCPGCEGKGCAECQSSGTVPDEPGQAMFGALTMGERIALSGKLAHAYQMMAEERDRLKTLPDGLARWLYGADANTYRDAIDDLLAVREDLTAAYVRLASL